MGYYPLNSTQRNRKRDMFLRVLRDLRGMISLSMLLNDPGMLYCDEPELKALLWESEPIVLPVQVPVIVQIFHSQG